MRTLVWPAAAAGLLAVSLALSQSRPSHEWPVYGGNSEGTRYSPLKQINRSNVTRLKVAWTRDVSGGGGRGGLQTNPIVVNGMVYGNTPSGRIIALDGATGEEVWSFD